MLKVLLNFIIITLLTITFSLIIKAWPDFPASFVNFFVSFTRTFTIIFDYLIRSFK